MFRFLSIVIILLAGVLPAHAAKRALIVGNDLYDELPDLQKAVADATAYHSVLSDLGYEVELATNLATTEMQEVIGGFIDRIERGDEVAFVYAGHGWSDGSTNYIISADTAAKTSLATLRRAAIPLSNGTNGVIDDMEAQGARIVLAVIDACRTNPFKSKLGRSGAVGLSRGLVLVTGASGTFTVFSAGAGEEALDRLSEDDPHRNSVFSRVFLAELAQGGSLQDTILDTAPKVAELAQSVGHVQRPAYYDGIGQRYCLTEDCQPRVTEASGVGPAVPPSQTTGEAPESAIDETALVLPSPDLPDATTDETGTDTASTSEEPAPVLALLDIPEVTPILESSVETIAPAEVEPAVPQAGDAVTAPLVAPIPQVAPVREAAVVFEPLPQQQQRIETAPITHFTPTTQTTPTSRPLQPPPRLVPGGPVQFVVRSASPVRTVDQLRHESICSVAKTPTQPTLRTLARVRGVTHNNRRFKSLARAVQALERSRCQGLAVPPRLVPQVLGLVRDATRYVVLTEVVQ